MTVNEMVINGAPTREEAAAVLAAVQVLIEVESAAQPQLPWPYRSAWRRAGIEDALARGPEQAVKRGRTRGV